jgi:23S rRNA U2552 (ribose-2'-O)-methylase RlmE/FtsJ
MIHYQIPRNAPDLYKNIDCIFSEHPEGSNDPSPVISNSLCHYLYDIKERIDQYESEWDSYKRYTNPYEYIHTPVPQKRKSVSLYKPLSRSYFKMVELTNFFRLLDGPNTTKPIRTFHLAEGPGGFIEALVNMRVNKDDEYIGMTILDDADDYNIPAWKKSNQFLHDNSNVHIETGADGTGDILAISNFEYCAEKYGSTMEIITGDGGFDFSTDFNNQEVHITRLLFGQIAYALCMQKRGGSFILKLFDCFMQHTLDAIAILSSFYDKVYITKPQTSRYANSEKYIVCRGFLFKSSADFYPILHTAFSKMVETDEKTVFRFLNIPLSLYFITKLEEFNATFGQQQVENIYFTISLIENKQKNDKLDTLIKTNVQRCINWCIKHNIQHYTSILENSSINVFSSIQHYPPGTQ